MITPVNFGAAVVRVALVAILVVGFPPAARAGLLTQDLQSGLTASDLVSTLVGPGAAVANIVYTGGQGVPRAAGRFSGGTGIIGIESGIILSTGDIANVIGPNINNNPDPNTVLGKKTAINGTPGDPALDNLITGATTLDASILDFDYRPTVSTLRLRAVFASEEYNEYTANSYSDVFGFFVTPLPNGVPTNYALTPTGFPIGGFTVNKDNPFTSAYYIDNEPPNALLNTAMDGLTVAFNLSVPMTPGQLYHIHVSIADGNDRILDSNVFLMNPNPETLEIPEPVTVSLLALGGLGLLLRRRRR